jgi:phospholipase/carboxylesterase
MSSHRDLAFVHRFQPGSDTQRPPLLLLHGTGADENDLLPLGSMIAPGAALLSPRGKVLEGTMPRFFRRLRQGVFDEDDVRLRAAELADFVAEAREGYGLGAPVAVGFSNGANIAAAVLLLRPEAFAGAILLRAMAPLPDMPRVALGGKPVLLLSGSTDPMISAEGADRLAIAFRGAGADIDHRFLPTGHGLTEADVTLGRAWLDRVAPRLAANRS